MYKCLDATNVILNEVKNLAYIHRSEESRVHPHQVAEILRYAQDDITKLSYLFFQIAGVPS